MISELILQYPLAVLFSLGILLWLSLGGRPRYRLPPGPPGLPIIGNLLDIPKTLEWIKYREWGTKYGSDLIHFRMLGTDVIVVNTTKAARALFEKRSSIYSDKVQSVMIHELTEWERNMAFMRYGDKWRAHRRMFHQHFRPEAVPAYHPAMMRGVRKTLSLLLDDPDNFTQHLRFMSGYTVLNVVYGVDAKDGNDRYIVGVEKAIPSTVVGVTGAFLVDSLPILKHIPEWFPGAQFKRKAREWKPMIRDMFTQPYKDILSEYDRGSAKPCVLSAILDGINRANIDAQTEETICNVTGMAYVAGVDTSVATLTTLFLAMILFPDVQAAAHAELDSVIGRGRLPELADRDSLPYITALFKELRRFYPILPLATSHACTTDDEYEGYHIPAGSIVIGNVWAMLREEERYPEPHEFKPHRFLDSEGQLDANVPDPIEMFGFSRRICAGRYFALDMVWLAVANILCAFDIEKPLDERGNVVEPSGEWISRLAYFPGPFKVAFKPRSTAMEGLIREERNAVIV